MGDLMIAWTDDQGVVWNNRMIEWLGWLVGWVVGWFDVCWIKMIKMIDVWMFGCLDVWMFGCLDVWMFGVVCARWAVFGRGVRFLVIGWSNWSKWSNDLMFGCLDHWGDWYSLDCFRRRSYIHSGQRAPARAMPMAAIMVQWTSRFSQIEFLTKLVAFRMSFSCQRD